MSSTLQKQYNLSFLKEKKEGFSFKQLTVPGYEMVLQVENPSTRLHALIAIHSTILGPSLGGIRIMDYSHFDDALQDVLRLSKGMTYKAAIAEVGFGGGKSVIIADPKKDKTEQLLYSFGEAVELLQGMYICAEDSGCTVEDALKISKATKYVTGLPSLKGSGDPGRYTAWGVFRGIQATAKQIFGNKSLNGVKIAIIGLGDVGSSLIEYLFWAGAEICISDIDSEKVEKCAQKYGATILPPEKALFAECDILCPCALGGIINESTISRFRCKAIAGAANNQLQKEEHADYLRMRDILYAPDYVINAGGLLNVSCELDEHGYDPRVPKKQTDRIYDSLLGIYEISEKNNISTEKAAKELAEYRIRYKIGMRTKNPVFHHSKGNVFS